MASRPDLYEASAEVYIRMVERDSVEAADALRVLHSAFGPRAALRAALIIHLLKMEISHRDDTGRIRFDSYLLQEYPEVIPLLEQAVAFCMNVWGIHDVDVQMQVGNQPELTP